MLGVSYLCYEESLRCSSDKALSFKFWILHSDTGLASKS